MTGPAEDNVSLRDFVEALFERNRQAGEQADRERQRSADALAVALARSIDEGDERLREHITNQINQIQAAMDAADKRHDMLRDEVILRDASLRDLLLQQANSNDLRVREAFAAAGAAIDKQEVANERRFDAVNAFREQLGEQATRFVSREVLDAQMEDLRARIESNSNAILSSRGESQGGAHQRQLTGAQISLLITVVGVIVAVVIAANTLSGP